MSKRNVWAFLLFGALAAAIGLAALTLDRFPAVNFDEVANAVMADHVPSSGRVYYPMMFGVVDPAFEELTASGQDGLRGLYMRALNLASWVLGHGVVNFRLLSFLLWIISGLLLFFLVKTHLGGAEACLSVLVWSLAFDAVLSAHMIRPDIWLGLGLIAMNSLFWNNRRASFWRWMISGGVGAASVGFHPHGLILIAWAFVSFWLARKRKEEFGGLYGLLLGLAIGVTAWLSAADVTTYVVGRHSYVMQLYRNSALRWVERLSPVQLLTDSVLLILRPDSFYVTGAARVPLLWKTAGFAAFLFQATSWAYAWVHGRAHPFIRIHLWGAAFFFFGIGYGHFRQEILYTLPITIFCLPLAAWSLIHAFHRRRSWPAGAALVLLTGGFSASAASTLIHQYRALTQAEPLSRTFDRVTQLAGGKPRRLLAPAPFWFYSGDSFRDVNALVLDYFYSAQKRPRTCVARYKPDVVVIDDDIRRRFLVGFDPATKKPIYRPASIVLGDRFAYLGSIPAGTQHTQLDVFRLSWETAP